MSDDLNQEREFRFGVAVRIAVVALAQFLVFCPIAIWTYPNEFSVASDYLSFLGCFEGPSSWHAWIFNSSLIGLGSGLFWLFWSLFHVTKNDPDDLLICSIGGMATAVSLIFVGLLPVNIFHDGHNFAMASWLLSTVVTLVFWIDWQRVGRKRKSTSVAKLGILAVAAYPFAVVAAFGPAMQKVIVLLAICWFAYFCLQLRQALRTGDVDRWLNAGPRTARRKKRVKVRYAGSRPLVDRESPADPRIDRRF